MAFDPNGVKFLLYARGLGVDFSRTAMIGRQRLQLTAGEMSASLRLFHERACKSDVADMFHTAGGYAEPFLGLLGAKEVHSFDNTTYEGASYAHDMNLPIAGEMKERFSVVIDGGSLEHVFNFPTAIRNCMEMVAVGGHFLSFAPSNNWMGHGFYQFSPELYFRLLSEGNGYRIVRLFACEQGAKAPWFTVRDPGSIKKRVGVISGRRVGLLVLARREERLPILKTMPQQSDYTVAWTRKGSPAPATRKKYSWRGQVRRGIKKGIRKVLTYEYGSFDPRLFERFDLAREVAALRTTPPGGSGH